RMQAAGAIDDDAAAVEVAADLLALARLRDYLDRLAGGLGEQGSAALERAELLAAVGADEASETLVACIDALALEDLLHVAVGLVGLVQHRLRAFGPIRRPQVDR